MCLSVVYLSTFHVLIRVHVGEPYMIAFNTCLSMACNVVHSSVWFIFQYCMCLSTVQYYVFEYSRVQYYAV